MSRERYFVPDLTPEAHRELRGESPRIVFVAESPHVNEIAPENREERRPLCGMAGKQWWSALSEILEGAPNPDVSLERLITLCRRNHIAVLNAVQFPLDPKIAAKVPGAAPEKTIGFDKGPGPLSFKKQKTGREVAAALAELRKRLNQPELVGVRVHPLGNDADWFLKQALGPDAYASRVGAKVAHPSAWWRQGGRLGREARATLRSLLASER